MHRTTSSCKTSRILFLHFLLLLFLLPNDAGQTQTPPDPRSCIHQCTTLSQRQHEPRSQPFSSSRCASILFKAGIDAYQQKQFAVAAHRSYCSNLLEHDRSALWNQLMAQMQIALQSQNYEQLSAIGLQCLEMPTQSPSDTTDKGNVHYLLGTSFSKSGNATLHNLALHHLKQATRLLPNNAPVLHSLATYQHQYNQTMDPQRFTRPQHMGAQQACSGGGGGGGNIIHSSDPLQKGNSVEIEHLNYSVHRSVIVFGSMSSITVRMQSTCTFLFPTRSFRLSPPVTIAPPSRIDSVFSKSFDQLGLAISFAPKNYYMLLTDSLPRAYLLKNVPHLLIPPLYSIEMQQLFSLLIGRTTISYNATQSYYVKRLHTVDWNWNTNPLKQWSQSLPNRVVLQLRRAMQASNILQMGRLKMSHTRSWYQLVYVERDAATDTRVLMPPLNKASILRMLRAQEDSHTNVHWNITHHQTNQKRTLLELVQSFNQADIVVGIHGAGLSNILFSPVHKRCILVELTPKEDVFYNFSSYKQYIELARSINTVTHLSVGMFDVHEFSTPTIQRTPRMNHLLQQVLQLAAHVVVASSAAQGHHHHRIKRIDRIAATRAETLGVGHHRAGNTSQAMMLYIMAESLHHNRPSVLVRRNKALIAYDGQHMDYALSQLLGLHGRIDREGLFQLELMKKQQIYLQTNTNVLYTAILPPTPVPSFEYGSLSYNNFYHQYWKQKTPVVFKNAIQKLITVNLTLEDIKQSECGAKIVDLFRHDKNSLEWAGFEKIGQTKLASFLTQQQQQQQRGDKEQLAYCVDFSIGRQCPALLQNIGFRMPRYVKDHLQNIGPTHKTNQKHSKKNIDIEKFVDHWPSLFVGRNGTKSGLHRDSIGSFWQLVVSGKKHWTMIDEHHHYLLEPDALRRTFSRTSFETVPRWEVIVEPGDLLMVPSNSAHAVKNVADSVALAGNFVDSTSYSDVVAELTLGTGIAPGYESLLAAFDAYSSVRNGRNRFAEEGENANTDLYWRDFKKMR